MTFPFKYSWKTFMKTNTIEVAVKHYYMTPVKELIGQTNVKLMRGALPQVVPPKVKPTSAKKYVNDAGQE